MSSIVLTPNEEEEVFVLVKSREGRAPEALKKLLRRLEQSLFERLTIEEMERLTARAASER